MPSLFTKLFRRFVPADSSGSEYEPSKLLRSYVGKTIGQIVRNHAEHALYTVNYKDEKILILQIPLEKGVLRCIIYNDICIEADYDTRTDKKLDWLV